jgi:Dimerisation domain
MLMAMSEWTPAVPSATAGGLLTESILGFVLSQAIYVAAVLGFADLLADGPQSATWLAVTVGADPDAVYRLLRLLAGHGTFAQSAQSNGYDGAKPPGLRSRAVSSP